MEHPDGLEPPSLLVIHGGQLTSGREEMELVLCAEIHLIVNHSDRSHPLVGVVSRYLHQTLALLRVHEERQGLHHVTNYHVLTVRGEIEGNNVAPMGAHRHQSTLDAVAAAVLDVRRVQHLHVHICCWRFVVVGVGLHLLPLVQLHVGVDASHQLAVQRLETVYRSRCGDLRNDAKHVLVGLVLQHQHSALGGLVLVGEDESCAHAKVRHAALRALELDGYVRSRGFVFLEGYGRHPLKRLSVCDAEVVELPCVDSLARDEERRRLLLVRDPTGLFVQSDRGDMQFLNGVCRTDD
mmetsp:Transcript_16771/g.31765  ORF Transcript_16771/g.31765 Transcript_16771/m.31765 type:complete len:295 (+) Transcript_16771:680-1564(+)